MYRSPTGPLGSRVNGLLPGADIGGRATKSSVVVLAVLDLSRSNLPMATSPCQRCLGSRQFDVVQRAARLALRTSTHLCDTSRACVECRPRAKRPASRRAARRDFPDRI